MNAVSGQQAGQEQLSPIEKLDKQDKRNKEIAREKTVEDTKKQILEVDMTETKFGADEEKMIYFFLLSSLRKILLDLLLVQRRRRWVSVVHPHTS